MPNLGDDIPTRVKILIKDLDFDLCGGETVGNPRS